MEGADMPENQTFAIVGASLAGAKAAETLRTEGFEERIVLLGAERERPYERPPLSKDYLRGESPREKAYVHPEAFYAESDIELRTATPVKELDAPASELVLEGGERLRYDRLLLATGAEPRRLPVPGAELEGVLYLRELDDSDAIAERLRGGGKVVVIGAGWIGAEVGASAREKGLDVTIVERGSVPLERVLGPEIGAIYADVHRDHGVQLVTGSGLEAFEGDRAVERVRLSDGRTIDCDFVVVGVGVAPRTGLAEAAGIDIDNGILVSERLETSAPGVFAAGDVANAAHPFYGRRIRVEHWANALNQGPAAAKNMLGKQEPYERLPYFFSDQYDVGMEYSGYATSWDEVVFRGDPGAREFIAFWLDGGSVVAGMNVNVWEVSDHIEALIRSGEQVDVARLRDPDLPLEELASRPALRSPERSRAGGSVKEFLAQGAGFAKHFVRGRLSKADATPASELASGEARVLQVDGEKLAVYRDEKGTLHAVSAVCTHMGCLVEWNRAEQTWDCPCHGSRFRIDGSVIQGPARRELKRTELPAEGTSSRGEAA
jgi:3-phenylpropionate/trans-cinnamate dioxygenase ferredoxin reductase subunit